MLKLIKIKTVKAVSHYSVLVFQHHNYIHIQRNRIRNYMVWSNLKHCVSRSLSYCF